LAITKSLIEMHGGHIEAYSDGLEQGARFVFHLPLRDSSAAPGSASGIGAAASGSSEATAMSGT
jgi:hypothetical protein